MDTITNIVTIRPDAWLYFCECLGAFCFGFLVLVVLSISTQSLLGQLRVIALINKDFDRLMEAGVGFSTVFGRWESVLLFLAAVAGQQVFAFAAGGWLVFKGISKNPHWNTTSELTTEQTYWEEWEAANRGLTLEEFQLALRRNRFYIFLLGTGFSVAAAGLAGAAYHWARTWTFWN